MPGRQDLAMSPVADRRGVFSTQRILLVVSLVPETVMAEYRVKASEAGRRPTSTAGMVGIILLWTGGATLLRWIGYARWSRR
jgi:hypothetical protein